MPSSPSRSDPAALDTLTTAAAASDARQFDRHLRRLKGHPHPEIMEVIPCLVAHGQRDLLALVAGESDYRAPIAEALILAKEQAWFETLLPGFWGADKANRWVDPAAKAAADTDQLTWFLSQVTPGKMEIMNLLKRAVLRRQPHQVHQVWDALDREDAYRSTGRRGNLGKRATEQQVHQFLATLLPDLDGPTWEAVLDRLTPSASSGLVNLAARTVADPLLAQLLAWSTRSVPEHLTWLCDRLGSLEAGTGAEEGVSADRLVQLLPVDEQLLWVEAHPAWFHQARARLRAQAREADLLQQPAPARKRPRTRT